MVAHLAKHAMWGISPNRLRTCCIFVTWAQLREELGAKVMLARAVPAKWSLLGVNKKPELIEKRRKELEVWHQESTRVH